MINQHRTGIRVGIVICLASCPLLMPFLASFTIQMLRIEGRRPIMAYSQLALGALATIEFVIPYVFMLVSTYRVDQHPDVTRALYDISWFFFLGVVSTFVLQLAIFGVAVLIDRRPKPVFPSLAWLRKPLACLGIHTRQLSGVLQNRTSRLERSVGLVGTGVRLPAVVRAQLRVPAARHRRRRRFADCTRHRPRA